MKKTFWEPFELAILVTILHLKERERERERERDRERSMFNTISLLCELENVLTKCSRAYEPTTIWLLNSISLTNSLSHDVRICWMALETDCPAYFLTAFQPIHSRLFNFAALILLRQVNAPQREILLDHCYLVNTLHLPLSVVFTFSL